MNFFAPRTKPAAAVPARLQYDEAAKVVEEMLSTAEVGTTVLWTELEKATGFMRMELYAISSQIRGRLEAANRGMFFTNVHGKGIARIDDQAVATKVIPKFTRKLRAVANQTLKAGKRLDLDQVKPEDRLPVLAHLTVAATVKAFTSAKSLLKLGQAPDNKPLGPREAMKKLFPEGD